MESITLCETGWSDVDLKPDCKKIKRIALQIDEFLDDMKRKHHRLTDNDLKTLFENIIQVLSKWTGGTWVGCRKDEELSASFQMFYDKLYVFIVMFRYQCKLGAKLAEKVLYQGKLYRYLGHSSGSADYNSRVKPEYNDIWVSWSKKDVRDNGYFGSKLYGTKTVLICNVTEKMGIDVGGFDEVFGTNLVRGEESEVVYPTFKDAVIEVIYLEDNDDE